MGILSAFLAIPSSKAQDSPESLTKNVKYIAPGGLWLDTAGNPIQAHAGGILKDGDLWYWIGQDEGFNKTLNSGFNLYSSPDLVTWTYRGQPL